VPGGQEDERKGGHHGAPRGGRCMRHNSGCSSDQQKPGDHREPGQRISQGEHPELCKEQ